MRRVFFVHEGPRRTATATSFFPRRTRRTTENGNCNCNFFLSTKGREGPRRATKNCNCNFFFPRRTRRATENCNCNCKFLLSTKGREGPRRATKNCNCNFLFSTEDTEGHGERQRQLPFFHDRPRRTTKNGNCRTSTATPLSTEDTEGHGELQLQQQLLFFREGPRSNAKNCNGNFFLSTKGREGPRRAAENGNGNFFFSTVIAKPQWLTGRSFLELFGLLVMGLVCGRGYGGQRTGCDEGRRWVRDGFGGGRCGGAAPAQGRAEGPTAHNTIMRVERIRLLASFRVGNQVGLRSC